MSDDAKWSEAGELPRPGASPDSWMVWTCDGEFLGRLTAGSFDAAEDEAESRFVDDRRGKPLEICNESALDALWKDRRRASRRGRQSTAFHEAGHVVMARHLEIEIVEVSIGPVMAQFASWFEPGRDSFGRVAFRNVAADFQRLGVAGAYLRRILIAMAGPMAEARCRGCADWRNLNWRQLRGSDLQLACDSSWMFMEERPCECRPRRGGRGSLRHHGRCAETCLERVVPYAATEVDMVWEAIEAVGLRLLEHGRLDTDEVDRIVSSAGRNDLEVQRANFEKRLEPFLVS